jgi:hypothetical protein
MVTSCWLSWSSFKAQTTLTIASLGPDVIEATLLQNQAPSRGIFQAQVRAAIEKAPDIQGDWDTGPMNQARRECQEVQVRRSGYFEQGIPSVLDKHASSHAMTL